MESESESSILAPFCQPGLGEFGWVIRGRWCHWMHTHVRVVSYTCRIGHRVEMKQESRPRKPNWLHYDALSAQPIPFQQRQLIPKKKHHAVLMASLPNAFQHTDLEGTTNNTLFIQVHNELQDDIILFTHITWELQVFICFVLFIDLFLNQGLMQPRLTLNSLHCWWWPKLLILLLLLPHCWNCRCVLPHLARIINLYVCTQVYRFMHVYMEERV